MTSLVGADGWAKDPAAVLMVRHRGPVDEEAALLSGELHIHIIKMIQSSWLFINDYISEQYCFLFPVDLISMMSLFMTSE